MKVKSTKKPIKRVKPGTSKSAAAARKAAFVEEYIVNGGNGTQAAIKAGYSPKTARSQATRLLADVSIVADLHKRQVVIAEKFALRTEDVLRELARIVYADPRKCFDASGNMLPVGQWPDEVAAMIASVESDEIKGEGGVVIGITRKIKLWDKNAAIEKAMKHLGQYERDNAQKNQFQEMTPDALDKFIERKAAEAAATRH